MLLLAEELARARMPVRRSASARRAEAHARAVAAVVAERHSRRARPRPLRTRLVAQLRTRLVA